MAEDSKPWEEFAQEPAGGGEKKPWEEFGGTTQPEEKGFVGHARDFGLSVAKGIVGVPEAAVGVADIATGGRVGKALENQDGAFGFRPKEAREFLGSLMTEQAQEQQRQFQEADGIVDKAKVAITNPSLVTNAIGESLPLMGAGGTAGRAVLAAAPRVGAALAGAAGEGIVGASSQAEQTRQETDDGLLSGKQAALSVASGGATSAFGALGGKLSQRLGIGDVDTILAAGGPAAVGASARTAAKSLPRSAVEGAIAEGLLEELPQSVSEQVLQNLAQDKPWTDGLADAVVMGVLTGGLMGGIAGPLHARPAEQSAPAARGPAPISTEGMALADGWMPPAQDPNALPPAEPGANINTSGLRLSPINDGPPASVPFENVQPEGPTGPGMRIDTSGLSLADDAGANVGPMPAPREFDSGGLELPQPGQTRSQAMGIDPNAGTLSAAAAMAVDGGAHDTMQAAAAAAQAAEQQDKKGDKPAAAPAAAPVASAQADTSGLFPTYEDADTYRRSQKTSGGGSIDALPVPDARGGFKLAIKGTPEYAVGEGLREARRVAKARADAGVIEGDITATNGMPFAIAPAAKTAAKKAGPDYEVVKVKRGYVVRKVASDSLESANSSAGKPGASSESSYVENATSGTAAAEGQAAPTEAAPPAGGDAPATAGLSAARPAALEASRIEPATDVRAVTSKTIPEMSDAELEQAAEHYGPDHKRTPKIHKEQEKRAAAKAPASAPVEAPAPAPAPAPVKEPRGVLAKKAEADKARSASAQTERKSVQTAPNGISVGDRVLVTPKPIGNNQTAFPPYEATVRQIEVNAPPAYGGTAFHVASDDATPDGRGTGWVGIDTIERAPEKKAEAPAPAPAPVSEPTKTAELPKSTTVYEGKGARVIDNEAMQRRNLGGVTLNAETTAALGENANLFQQAAQREARESFDAQGNFTGEKYRVVPIGRNGSGIRLFNDLQEAKEFADAYGQPKNPQPRKSRKVIGKNERGAVVYENKEGRRSYTESGFRYDEEPGKPREKEFMSVKELDTGAAPAPTMSNPGPATADDGKSLLDYLKGLALEGREAPATGMKNGVTYEFDAAPFVKKGEVLISGLRKLNYSAMWQKALAAVAKERAAERDRQAIEVADRFGLKRAVGSVGVWTGTVGNFEVDLSASFDRNYRNSFNVTTFDLRDKVATNQMADFKTAVEAGKHIEKVTGATAPAAKADDFSDIDTAALNERLNDPERAAAVLGQIGEEVAAQTGKPAPEKAKPAEYGASNKLVSKDRAEELRAKLRKKLGTLNSGIDPEVLGAGVELAVFHLEAGVRKFADVARALASDLGSSVEALKPYLRSWYNGARDMMEDHGHSIEGMDSADVVRSELSKIATAEASADTGGTENGGNATRELDSPSESALAGALPEDVRTPDENRPAEQGADGRGGRDGTGDSSADAARVDVAGSVGGMPGDVSVPAGGTRADAQDGKKPRVPRAPRPNARTERLRPEQGGLNLGDEPNQAPNVPAVAAPQITAEDFTIADDLELGEGGEKTKFRNNVAAIRLVRELEDSGRLATPDEQKVLAKYVGWGALSNAFDEGRAGWERENAELKSLLNEQDYADARRSTRYAHYTSRPIIVDGIYAALRRFGFTGGKTLEAGAGVGNFLGLMPADMRSAGRFTAIEREPISSAIAKQLYPQQIVVRDDFTQFRGNDAYFDAAVGNPPFAADPQTDLSGRKHLSGLSLHNYFFAKSIDMLREGGVLAQVVTNAFLDAKTDAARRYIADRTVFLGAIRLPNNAFSKNAGTEVTTDIIFLQKRPDGEIGGKAAKADAKRWLGIGEVTDKNGRTAPLNQYFIDNPDMMLGDFGLYGTMYRGDMPALVARDGQDTLALLKAAVKRLPADVYKSIADSRTEGQSQAAIVALKDPSVQEGGYYVDGDKLHQRLPDLGGEARAREITPVTQWTEKTTLGDAGFARIKALAGMRSTLRGLIAAEMSDDDKGMGQLRAKLNEQYDVYQKEFGFINDAGTLRVFDDDPDFPLLASLEHNYTPGIGVAAAKRQGIKPTKSTAKKAPIFDRRVVAARTAITKVETPADAIAVSMAERGRLDAAYIGKLLGRDADEALREMTTGEKPLLFRDPATDEFVLRDAYLSGNVRAKLAQAKTAGMNSNVRALEEVQPEDVGASEIVARVGSPWVPESVYADFAKHLFGEGTNAHVKYLKANSSYGVYITAGNDVAWNTTWGTKHMDGGKILAAMLNNRVIKVTRTDKDGKTHTLQDETEAAQAKEQEIRNAFNDWLFADGDRAETLVRAYNDTNNNYVTRVYDGSMMTFPGKVPDEIINFRRHQRNFIARVVQDRTALADHVVGAGKTFGVVASAMELKRTGLASKNMVAVPNHLVKQWAADFYRLYPGANILTATKKDFSRENRRKFLAKIATGDWDAVVIAHSSFGFIKPAPEFEAAFNQREIDSIVATIKQVEEDDGDKPQKKRTVKQLEGLVERLENRIKALRDKPMDDLLDFEQIGVDQLFVDEFHMFKNLMFSTKMQNVQGLGDSTGSQRAYDMYVKINQIYAKNGRDQGFVAATGTPVSNSLAEMYHMMRYLMPTAMKELGFDSFDAWANTFASVEQVWMQKPSGDGFKASARMSNFVNTPELLKMFDQVCDTVTMDDIKRAYAEENPGKEFPLPKIKGGRRQPISLDKTPSQEAFMEELAKRALAVENRKGPPKKGEDNVLVIMGDGRKAAMDIRLVDLDRTEREKGGRIDVASDELVRRYNQFNHVKGTQLVFSDLGTPIKHAKAELKEFQALQERVSAATEDVQASASLGNEQEIATMEDAEAAQEELDAKGKDWLDAVKAAERGFSVYDDLKAALVQKGIPENEVAFIHDYNTDDQKAALFRKVNAGDIRVLLGSTAKMGAGTNVQERLVAEHHLDVPWRPSDVEQREGRIERQGNILAFGPNGTPGLIPGFEAEILAYVTKDTLDMRMWQVQETKLKMINQLRTRKVGREVDNAFEDLELSAGEMQAAATGNIDLLHEIQLRTDVKKLEQRKRSFDASRNELETRRRRNAQRVAELPAQIEAAKPLADQVKAYDKEAEARLEDFKATIDGKEYTDWREAQAYLREVDDRKETVEDLAGEKKERAAPIDVEINGERYKARAKMAEAFSEIRGDMEPIIWKVGRTEYRRRARIENAIRSAVYDSIADQVQKGVGTIAGFDVKVETETDKQGNPLMEVTLWKDGSVVASTTTYANDSAKAPAAVVRGVDRMLSNIKDDANHLGFQLARAKKEQADLEKTEAVGEWPDADKLATARAKHKEVLQRLAKKKASETPAEQAAADDSDADGVVFRRSSAWPASPAVRAQAVQAVTGTVDAIRAAWGNAPETIVAFDMSDSVIPERVRQADLQQRSGGASGAPEGFYYRGKVYLMASQLKTPQDAARVLFHEALGHYGLRGTFGKDLDLVLNQIAVMRRAQVEAKIEEYGLRGVSDLDRHAAAEEVLAEMAQTMPTIGFVQRAVAAIRTWLRENVPGFKGLELTDAEIIRNYILPARRFVEGGAPNGGGVRTQPQPAFSRDGRAIEPVALHLQGWDGSRSQLRALANAWYSENLQGKSFRNDDMGVDVQFSSEGKREAFGTSGNLRAGWRAEMVKALPDLIKRGVKVQEAAPDERRTHDTKAFHTLVAPLSVNGEILAAKITLRESLMDPNGTPHKFYDVAALQIENGSEMSGVAPDVATGPVHPTGSEPSAVSVSDLKKAINLPGDDAPMFSRATVKAYSDKAVEVLNHNFNAPGKLSWWHKTIGTMYNLAELDAARAQKEGRAPAFKPVFQAAQGFVDDVSYYATDAADMAPKLLPQLEEWKDITKAPISAADNKAVAKPVFEGTLLWMRDANGKPVKVTAMEEEAAKMTVHEKAQRLLAEGKLPERMLKAWQGLPIDSYTKAIDTRYGSQMLAAGIVWTDSELRSMFGLNDAQIDLYKEFRASTDRSLDTMARSDMLRYGGDDVKGLRDAVMDATDADEASILLRDYLLGLMQTNPDRATQLGVLANGMIDRAAKVADLKNKGYAPLSRFGKYTVDVVADGERQYFGLFETAREANQMALKMRAEFGKDSVTQGTLSDEAFKMFAGITPESLELFGNMLGLDSTGDSAQDQAFQEYLRLTKSNRSAMKRLIHRKGIAGYSEDVGRVLAAFVYSNSRQTAAGLHMGDLGEAITAIPKEQGELKDAAMRLADYVKNPQEEAQAVRGLLFAQYLGGSVASAFVNMTQPVAVTFPWLSQYAGARQSAAELVRAIKEMASKNHKYEPDLEKALKHAEDDGTVSPQEVHQLMAQARGAGTLQSGDGTKVGDARAKASNALSRLSLAWGKVFGMAEQVNRRATFIAAYRVARSKNMPNPGEFAKKAVTETQFLYSKANKMRFARGAVGGTLMTFKTYSVAYLELLHRMWLQGGPEGKKAALLALAVLMIMGGAGGLPFADDADDAVDGFAQLLGYNFNSKKAKQDFLEGLFVPALASFIDRGITGLPGAPIDISGRMGMGNLIPGTGLFTEKTSHTQDVLEIAGPAGDFAGRIFSGTRKVLGGDVGSGLLEVAPTAVRNAAKGADMAATGMYRDAKGYKILDTNALEAAMKAIGFQPASVSKIQEANADMQQSKAFYNLKAQEIRSKWANGIFEGDKAAIQSARDDIAAWNRKNPDQPMRIDFPSILKRVKEMRKSKDQRIADTAPKAMRAQLREEIKQTRESI